MHKAPAILIPWFFFTGLYLLSPGLANPKYQTLLINETSKIFVEIVTSREEQRKGLGFRNQLEDGKGMLFVYSNSSERIFRKRLFAKWRGRHSREVVLRDRYRDWVFRRVRSMGRRTPIQLSQSDQRRLDRMHDRR